ncbi:MAG TPA: hypothetical protein VFL97_02635 [Nitrococcus sp.]|nr:hypothetical protein [Nitrococcus sp.]
MEKTTHSNRITRDFDLASMSREELEALLTRIDVELEARAFESNLRREVEYHLRKQSWPTRRNGGGRQRY